MFVYSQGPFLLNKVSGGILKHSLFIGIELNKEEINELIKDIMEQNET